MNIRATIGNTIYDIVRQYPDCFIKKANMHNEPQPQRIEPKQKKAVKLCY